MRIEISAGGIGYGTSVMEFSSVFDGFLSNTDNVISCFKTVKNETYSLSGGAGNLQTALDDLESRVRTEESLKENAVLAKAKSDSFLSLAQRIDNQVANDVKKNRDEFYSVNSWAKPTTSNEEKKWYEKAWDWLCKADKAIAGALLAPWVIANDLAHKLWSSAVDFYKEHKLEIINLTVTILCVAGSIAIIALTGGASLLVIAGVSALSAAIISGTRNATDQYAKNGSFVNFDWNSFTKDVLFSAVIGGITGVLGAGISSLATGVLSNTALATFLNSSNVFMRFFSGATIGSISQSLSGIITRGVGQSLKSLFVTGSVDFASVKSSALDYRSILFDFVIGGTFGGIHVAKSPIGKEITLDNIDKIDIQSKPYHSPNPNTWLENGGKIFIDGNGTWTYQAPDGVHTCYSGGFPDFERAGIVNTEYTVPGGFDTSNHSVDINEAIRSTGLGGKGSNFTWHHYQDGKTLQLVDTYYHNLFRHVGGFSLAKGV